MRTGMSLKELPHSFRSTSTRPSASTRSSSVSSKRGFHESVAISISSKNTSSSTSSRSAIRRALSKPQLLTTADRDRGTRHTDLTKPVMSQVVAGSSFKWRCEKAVSMSRSSLVSSVVDLKQRVNRSVIALKKRINLLRGCADEGLDKLQPICSIPVPVRRNSLNGGVQVGRHPGKASASHMLRRRRSSTGLVITNFDLLPVPPKAPTLRRGSRVLRFADPTRKVTFYDGGDSPKKQLNDSLRDFSHVQDKDTKIHSK